LALLLACLGGCNQWRYNIGGSLDQGADLQPSSRANLAQALALLGPPLRVSSLDEGYMLAWEHWKVREDTVGVRLGLLGVDFLSIDWGDARAQGEYLLLTFDDTHQLTGRAYGTFDTDAGGGRAVQPIFSPVDLVEVDDLTSRMPTHRWGATLLQELPVVLNTQNSPRSGAAGLEQRGTPSGIGQRSLEMD